MNNPKTTTVATTTTVESGSQSRLYSKWDRFVRSLLFKTLKQLKHSHLTITDEDGSHEFGDKQAATKATVTVHHPDFYHALAGSGSVGAAEQYVAKSWDCADLTQLVEIFVINQPLLDSMEGGLAWLKNTFLKVGHFFNKNTKLGSKKNISMHYDLGNEMFKLFLDSKMMYSSAVFQNPTDTLEQASEYKLKIICEKLNLTPRDHIIEIGTGWGGFAIYAAQNYGCRVTTTTISSEQYGYTKNLIEQNKLTDKITLLKKDYRDLSGEYDKLVSIEMIEAVGHQYLSNYLQKCDSLLKPEGQALIQAITIEDHRYKKALKSVDFIKKYIFPGSFIPSISQILKTSAYHSELKLHHLQDIGKSYALTLNHWKQRFESNSYLLNDLGYKENFQRLWEFYFCYCEGGFLQNSISAVQMLFTKPRTSRKPLSF